MSTESLILADCKNDSTSRGQQQLGSWNATDVDCDSDRCIHWLLEAQAARTPRGTAVDDGQSALTYGELNSQANRLAHRLRETGVERGQLVGVCMTRSKNLIVALIAILKCGAAYVPMEPAWPDERRRFITESLGLNAVIIDQSQSRRAWSWGDDAEPNRTIVCLDDEVVRPEPTASNPPHDSRADDTAYIIFTSGSSGQPKGVVVRHRSVINLIDWVNKIFAIDHSDRILFTTSIAFDLSVYDVFGVLAAGGTVRLASDEEVADPQRLAGILQAERITFWDSAPAALERLSPFFSHGQPGALRLAFLSGDWIPLTLPPLIQIFFPGVRVIALGGATEATVWSNFYEVKKIDPTWVSIPYGRPIQNAKYYVLNESMNPCTVGETGELYIGGLCLAAGYASDPELTRRKFVADPFDDEGLIYRTGDRARFFADGNIEFLGRADRQIKIRGFRVEPAEIEAVLQRHPQVRRAVVVAEGEQRGARRITAHVVLCDESQRSDTAADLRAYVRDWLPEHMVPAKVNIASHLPINANGKIDRAALRKIKVAGTSRVNADPPSTEAQRQLVKLWRRILRLEQVGIHDSFFDLGADSLQSVEMITAAAGLGIDIRFKGLGVHQTIAALAVLRPRSRASCVANEGTDDIPLTPTQQWFFNRRLRFPERYNSVFAFDVVKRVDLRLFREAVRNLFVHHDALLLRFKRADERWVQFQAERSTTPEIDSWDVSMLAADQAHEEIEKSVADLRRSFDLEGGPLTKVVLLARGSQLSQQMLLILHHLVFDAVSLQVLVDDLTIACDQLSRGLAVNLPAATGFSRYAHHVSNYGCSEQAIASEKYWFTLPWDEVKPLPKDLPSGRNCYGTSRTVCAALSEEETAAFTNAKLERSGASVGEILLAACAMVLSSWANHPTVLIDLTDHGRRDLLEDFQLSRTVGYITANIPLVLEIPSHASLGEVAAIVHSHLQEMPHAGIGYGILRYSKGEGSSAARLRRCPSAEVKFNFLGSMTSIAADTELFRAAPMSFQGVLDPQDERAYLLNFEIAIKHGCLHIECKFNETIHRRDTIGTLLAQYIGLLRQNDGGGR